jgi:thymidylate kinase
MTIAFLGQDGAGKSTVTTDLEKWLRWKMEARRFYLGSGEHYMSWEKRMLIKLSGKRSFFIRKIKTCLQLMKYIRISKNVLKTILRARRYADNGGIALFDRYPQTIVYGINDGPKIRELYAKSVHNSFLKSLVLLCAQIEEKNLKKAAMLSPNMVIKLFLPPEESIRRKPHENMEVIKRKHQIIKMLMFDGSETHTIDATKEYDKELLEIKSVIWAHLIA